MKYGYLDVRTVVERGWMPVIVLLNGIDVSDICVACDDINGYVTLYHKTDVGEFRINPKTGKPVLIRHNGVVEVFPNSEWNKVVSKLLSTVR